MKIKIFAHTCSKIAKQPQIICRMLKILIVFFEKDIWIVSFVIFLGQHREHRAPHEYPDAIIVIIACTKPMISIKEYNAHSPESLLLWASAIPIDSGTIKHNVVKRDVMMFSTREAVNLWANNN